MKKMIAILCMLCLGMPFVAGCQGAKQDDGPRLIDYKEDIRFFTRSALRILILEKKENLTEEDLHNVQKYLAAAVDIIDNEEDPDFNDLRMVVADFLPDEYQSIGLSVVDVVERYVLNHVLDNLDDKQKEIKNLILCALKGAEEAVQDAHDILFPDAEH